MGSVQIIFCVIFSFLPFFSTGQLLCQKSNTNLAIPTAFMAYAYDGDDSIILFGGYNGNSALYSIVKYSISNDTAVTVGQLPYNPSTYGIAVKDDDGFIQFVDQNADRVIFKFFPPTNSFTEVGTFPMLGIRFDNTAVQSGGNNMAWMFGETLSGNQNIYTWNLQNREITLKDIPLPVECSDLSATWTNSDSFLLLGHCNQENPKGATLIKYNTTTGESQVFQKPYNFSQAYPRIMWDNTEKVAFGVLDRLEMADPSKILKFDPVTGEEEFLSVQNFPSNQTHTFSAGAVVFAEKVRRIYFLGGTMFNGDFHQVQDGIWFIDLN